MSRVPRPTRLLHAALGGLLVVVTTVALVAPAQAAPRSPDPELVQVQRAATQRTAPAQRALPGSVDSDLYAYVVSPSARTYFVVAGHLKLALASGSSTRYTGTFTDHVGGKSTKASADASHADAPTLTIKAKNGTFTFRADSSFGTAFYGATGTKVPKTFTPAGSVYLSAANHTVKTASYQLTLTERSGPTSTPYEYTGTITIAYDANARISGGAVTVTDAKGRTVTHRLSSSGYYSSAYLYTVAKVDKKTFGLYATASGTSFSGAGFTGSGSKTSQWVFSATA